MTRQGVVKRPARPKAAADAVVVIDAPNEQQCGLPAGRRTCVSTTCPAALTGRLPPGVDHPTMCALDAGGLLALTPTEADRARPVEWRRHDCERLFACEEAWIEGSHAGAKCPRGCLGFVRRDSGLVPMSALARARKDAA